MSLNPYPVPQSSRKLTSVAWITTILISTLPDILADKFFGAVPKGLVYGKAGLLLGLFAAALAWRSLRPLRNFFLIMFAFFGLNELRTHVNFTWAALQSQFGGSVFDARSRPSRRGSWPFPWR